MIGIYKITNTINNKVYIGQSVDITARWTRHKNDCKKEKFSHYPLYRSFNKYGIDNFTFEVIEECSKDCLDEREKYWIGYYNSFYNGYNQTKGGQLPPHFNVLNQETLKAIIYDLKNTSLSGIEIANKYNISDQMVSDINTGKSWHDSEESYPLRTRTITRTRTRNLAEGAKNYCPNCGCEIMKKSSFCVKCSGKNNRKVERPSKELLLEKIYNSSFLAVGREYGVSDNAIRKWCISYGVPSNKKDFKNYYEKEVLKITKEEEEVVVKTKNSKPLIVVQCDKMNHDIVIAEYPSSHAAGRALGDEQKYKHIGDVCRGVRKSAYGYYWKYKTEN